MSVGHTVEPSVTDVMRHHADAQNMDFGGSICRLVARSDRQSQMLCDAGQVDNALETTLTNSENIFVKLCCRRGIHCRVCNWSFLGRVGVVCVETVLYGRSCNAMSSTPLLLHFEITSRHRIHNFRFFGVEYSLSLNSHIPRRHSSSHNVKGSDKNMSGKTCTCSLVRQFMRAFAAQIQLDAVYAGSPHS